MGAYLQWSPSGSPLTKILEFDLTVTETHGGTADITKHPVEKGADVSDHVRLELDHVTLEMFVSNAPLEGINGTGGTVGRQSLDLPAPNQSGPSPLGTIVTVQDWRNPSPFVGFELDIPTKVKVGLDPSRGSTINAQVLQFSTTFDAVSECLQTLRKLQADTQILTVLTSKKIYENMILASFILTRGPDDGTGATLTLEFQQLRIIETNTVAAPVPTETRGNGAVSKGAQGPKTDKSPKSKKSVLKALRGGTFFQ